MRSSVLFRRQLSWALGLFACLACEPSKLVQLPENDGGPWRLPTAQPGDSPEDVYDDAGFAQDAGASNGGGDPCPQLTCGVWVEAGNLLQARTRHSATLLQDGQVLVVGGEGEGGTLASVERYDPASDAFETVGPLQHPRYDHAAIGLADGRILVVGGVQGVTRVAQAEVFNPQTGDFEVAGSLAQPRIGHTLTRLNDGRVLVVGGLGEEAFATDFELFDLATGEFTTVATSSEARYLHTSTLLADGSVFIAGGMRVRPGVGVEYVERTERYVPSSGLETGPMWLSARRNHSASRLSSGTVMLAGGHNAGATSSVWFFEPTTSLFAMGPDLRTARFAHQATNLEDDSILISGGIGEEALSSAEAFGEEGMASWALPPMQHARHTHTATRLLDGSVLVVGGTAPGQGIEPVAASERFMRQRD